MDTGWWPWRLVTSAPCHANGRPAGLPKIDRTRHINVCHLALQPSSLQNLSQCPCTLPAVPPCHLFCLPFPYLSSATDHRGPVTSQHRRNPQPSTLPSSLLAVAIPRTPATRPDSTTFANSFSKCSSWSRSALRCFSNCHTTAPITRFKVRDFSTCRRPYPIHATQTHRQRENPCLRAAIRILCASSRPDFIDYYTLLHTTAIATAFCSTVTHYKRAATPSRPCSIPRSSSRRPGRWPESGCRPTWSASCPSSISCSQTSPRVSSRSSCPPRRPWPCA